MSWPTFTLRPIIGEEFADSFIRPLSPTELMPLIEGGIPVDVLFRLGVQSVNNLQNASALAGNASQGSPLFFLLLRNLRNLQIAGLLDAAQHNGDLETIPDPSRLARFVQCARKARIASGGRFHPAPDKGRSAIRQFARQASSAIVTE